MSLDMSPFERYAELAVQHFWENRGLAARRQSERGALDQGERAGVTAGHNMDGFANLFAELARANGLTGADVHVKKALVTLPGYFRPTKTWDLVVLHDGRLVAVVEFKSQVGPSFGNNFNNRAEEAIGAAADFWTAHREGAFRDPRPPFLGWLILVEDCAVSRKPGKPITLANFSAFPEFQTASYLARYNILCRKLMQERLYTGAAVVAATRGAGSEGVYPHLADGTSIRALAVSFASRIAAEAMRGSLAGQTATQKAPE
ncbi:MAG: PaeR7I family type II restriction endonuclease [Bifidobacteriaceae bacterium]|nr:PaeR7I family type II restriction endonuclease [Bifidobacteriaceae bacterium]